MKIKYFLCLLSAFIFLQTQLKCNNKKIQKLHDELENKIQVIIAYRLLNGDFTQKNKLFFENSQNRFYHVHKHCKHFKLALDTIKAKKEDANDFLPCYKFNIKERLQCYCGLRDKYYEIEPKKTNNDQTTPQLEKFFVGNNCNYKQSYNYDPIKKRLIPQKNKPITVDIDSLRRFWIPLPIKQKEPQSARVISKTKKILLPPKSKTVLNLTSPSPLTPSKIEINF